MMSVTLNWIFVINIFFKTARVSQVCFVLYAHHLLTSTYIEVQNKRYAENKARTWHFESIIGQAWVNSCQLRAIPASTKVKVASLKSSSPVMPTVSLLPYSRCLISSYIQGNGKQNVNYSM